LLHGQELISDLGQALSKCCPKHWNPNYKRSGRWGKRELKVCVAHKMHVHKAVSFLFLSHSWWWIFMSSFYKWQSWMLTLYSKISQAARQVEAELNEASFLLQYGVATISSVHPFFKS
jgi:hypothetical protein